MNMEFENSPARASMHIYSNDLFNIWHCFMNLICKDNKDKNIEYSGQIYN